MHFTKNLRNIFGISTGASSLNDLINIYEKNIQRFNYKVINYPIIFIYDNDKGAEEIKKKIKKKHNLKNIKSSYNFYVENLYILFVPEIKNKAIEDLFEKKILKTKLNGKVFSRASKINSQKEYSKNVFAEKVIRAKQNEINFDCFKEVMDSIEIIISDYKKKKS